MDKSATTVATIFHHSIEERTYLKGIEYGYEQNVTYFHITTAQMRAIMSLSVKCEQYLRYECKGSVFNKNVAWLNAHDGSRVELTNRKGEECGCLLLDSCNDTTRADG